jgi:hypothetical protein
MRLALALLLALFVGQVLVVPAAAALEVCAATCPDDGPDGTCDPTCADCTCCDHGTQPLAPGASALAPVVLRVRALADAILPAMPASDSRDVFHVPRSLA